MDIHLIQGQFNSNDAIEIITQMIHIKIKYHENKIKQDSNEEDIKYRESRIKNLQKELYDLRNYVDKKSKSVKIEAQINVS